MGWYSFVNEAATNRRQTIMGGSRTQVGEPGTKEPGRPEGLPRTAAITLHCYGHKKAPAMEIWAPVRLLLIGSPNPVAE